MSSLILPQNALPENQNSEDKSEYNYREFGISAFLGYFVRRRRTKYPKKAAPFPLIRTHDN
jgi:hypothetical protein